jgi:ribosome biogenesis GTPase A
MSWKTVLSEIKRSDGVLEVVDARCPNEFRSKKLEKMFEELDKPFWIIINKVDLVPKDFADKCKKILKEQSKAVDVVHVSSKKFYGFWILRRSLKGYFGDNKAKLAVVGFPNVGKSSLINMLAQCTVVATAPMPGHTKGKQWIRISSKLLISDLPGVIPKEFANKDWAKILFPDDVEESAFILLEKIEKAEGTNFEELYGVKPKPNEETLEKIALKFGFLRKGGEPDTHRSAQRLLNDWNNCKLTAWWI